MKFISFTPTHERMPLGLLNAELVCFFTKNAIPVFSMFKHKTLMQFTDGVCTTAQAFSYPLESIDVLIAIVALRGVDISDVEYIVYRPEIFKERPQ